MQNNKWISALQGLRGYAILMIFLSHCNYILNEHGINCFAWLGGLGVSIFIMLSGYLLAFQNHETSSIISIDKIKNSLKRFYPLHIFTLLVSFPFCIDAFLHGNVIKQGIKLMLNALLLQAWIPSSGVYFSFNAVSWYLSLTMFFVIVGPITLRMINKMKRKTIPFLLVGILLFEFIWCWMFKSRPFAHWIIYIFPIVRYFDYMAGGGVVWKVIKYHQCNKDCSVTAVLLFGISALLMIILTVFSLNTQSEYFLTAVWFIPAIMMISAAALGDRVSKIIDTVFSNKVILYIGKLSFELFLIHQLVIRYVSVIFNKLLNYNGLFIYVSALLISILCAEMWRLIIKKIRR